MFQNSLSFRQVPQSRQADRAQQFRPPAAGDGASSESSWLVTARTGLKPRIGPWGTPRGANEMLEREMEDLIAGHPDYFFPRQGLVLQGRQQSFQGVGRFDLLFTDRHGMNVLMELKAVPARYDAIDQVARYRDLLLGQIGRAHV